MKYIYLDKEIEWKDKDKCPLCNSNIVLKKQKQEEGCIKIRYFKCVNCEFDTRNLE